jgi:hypothetical protein
MVWSSRPSLAIECDEFWSCRVSGDMGLAVVVIEVLGVGVGASAGKEDGEESGVVGFSAGGDAMSISFFSVAPVKKRQMRVKRKSKGANSADQRLNM